MVTSPENKNMLSQTGFKLSFERLPNVTYFSQSSELPGITLGSITYNNPLHDYPIAGEKLTFEPFNVTFRVDENMTNFLELYNWLVGIAGVESSEERRLYELESRNNSIYSDATLIVLSSKYNANLKIKFKDLFPESITSLRFESTASDIEYLECTTTLRYRNYTIERHT
jgi:hypothetical protein